MTVGWASAGWAWQDAAAAGCFPIMMCCLPVTLLFGYCLAAADVAWYEGRYPSQLAAPGQQQKRGAARRAALAVTDTG